jgi:hypothetical protein
MRSTSTRSNPAMHAKTSVREWADVLLRTFTRPWSVRRPSVPGPEVKVFAPKSGLMGSGPSGSTSGRAQPMTGMWLGLMLVTLIMSCSAVLAWMCVATLSWGPLSAEAGSRGRHRHPGWRSVRHRRR